ncbi:MAG: c-type cytochrome [Vicinamibacterales bacterium]
MGLNLSGGLAVFLVSGLGGIWLAGQATADGAVFTAAQAEAGRKAYQAQCASCHAGDLGGRDDAPALTGDTFMATWGARTTTELFDFVRTTMPPEGSSMTPDEYLAIVAHVLGQNGAKAGSSPLTATTGATINVVATGKRPPSVLDVPMMARR